MVRSFVRGTAFAALAGAALLCSASEAQAGWGWHGSSGGSYGSYGSSGSWGSHGSSGSHGSHGSHGSWASHGSHGSHGGLFARWHARHRYRHYRGSHGSHGSHGSWGSHGSYGSYGSTGSHGSHGGSHGSWTYSSSCGSSGGTVIYSKPMAVPAEVAPATGDAPAPPAPEGSASTADQATMTVSVPDNARVFVNEAATRSTGSVRNYVSRGLKPGFKYTYKVRAEFDVNGNTVEQTREVVLTAGTNTNLTFDFNTAPAVATTLTLRVPEGAKVSLAGSETAATGAVRVFTTKKLTAGQEWDNYVIRVSFEREGKLVEQEKTITLTGGDDRSIEFDFDSVKVADNR